MKKPCNHSDLTPASAALLHNVPSPRKLRRIVRIAFLILLSCAAAVQSFAQVKEDLTANLTAKKVAVVEGKEAFSPAAEAKPGEVIEYTASYRNQSVKALGNVQPVLPIPAGSRLIGASLAPKPAAASTDGVRFSPFPLKRTVALPDGSQQVVAVPLAEYRALRWDLGTLTPNSTRAVTARVELLTNTPQTAAR